MGCYMTTDVMVYTASRRKACYIKDQKDMTMLWGDLKILFQPDEEDEVWRHQHKYNLISWRLFDSCRIHILLMDNRIAIHILTQEMLSKMLSRKLEVDHENEMAFELLRFIRSQGECWELRALQFITADGLSTAIEDKEYRLIDVMEMEYCSLDFPFSLSMKVISLGYYRVYTELTRLTQFQYRDCRSDIADSVWHRVWYTCWDFHGEKRVIGSTSECNMDDDLPINNDRHDLNNMLDDLDDDVAQKEHAKFEKLFLAAEKALFDGCTKLTILSAVIKLFKIKASFGSSDISFTTLLEFLHKEMLPDDNALPISTYQAKKLMCPMDLEIKELMHVQMIVCCIEAMTKIYMRARLERLYADAKEAKLLRWHAEERKKDGKMRHVADSLQWRNIDNSFKEFGGDIRNIRLGLSSDGFNPFGNMSTSHSTWPVLLCNYNLPPWLCMKRKYIMMSLLIQGPKQPGNDIDVYLKPLIDDLIKLWEPGVKVYDAYSKNYFTLRAMIFCTISDFPAYDNLSGYSTKGKKACPVCEDCTHSVWLRHCRKTIYMGHRRSLLRNQPYRKKKELFDGTIERGVLRPPLDGEATFSRVRDINIVLGKGKDNPGPLKGIWKKKSIFWVLPY
ncbi:uncharacterized protein Tco_0053736 [Tanacetum coccineum]